MQAVLKDDRHVVVARYEIPHRFRIARHANGPVGPVENRGRYRGSRYSPPSQDEAPQVGGLLEPTALVPVIPPLGTLHSHITEL